MVIPKHTRSKKLEFGDVVKAYTLTLALHSKVSLNQPNIVKKTATKNTMSRHGPAQNLLKNFPMYHHEVVQ